MSLCTISHNPKACKFYLIPQMMILVAWNRSRSPFADRLDFFRLQDSIKFVLLNFHL